MLISWELQYRGTLSSQRKVAGSFAVSLLQLFSVRLLQALPATNFCLLFFGSLSLGAASLPRLSIVTVCARSSLALLAFTSFVAFRSFEMFSLVFSCWEFTSMSCSSVQSNVLLIHNYPVLTPLGTFLCSALQPSTIRFSLTPLFLFCRNYRQEKEKCKKVEIFPLQSDRPSNNCNKFSHLQIHPQNNRELWFHHLIL